MHYVNTQEKEESRDKLAKRMCLRLFATKSGKKVFSWNLPALFFFALRDKTMKKGVVKNFHNDGIIALYRKAVCVQGFDIFLDIVPSLTFLRIHAAKITRRVFRQPSIINWTLWRACVANAIDPEAPNEAHYTYFSLPKKTQKMYFE